MGTWNHRVVVTKSGDENYLQIHEVYYNANGGIRHWTVNPVTIGGYDADEIRATLQRIEKALKDPWLIERRGELHPFRENPGMFKAKEP